MKCNKFLKVKARVSGFLIAKIEKRNEKYALVIKNTITGLQYLLNAFQTYMSGVTYTGATASSTGITITTSSGKIFTLPFSSSPGIYVTNNSIVILFTAKDNSNNSYTAISEELITQSAGYYIPIATASLSVTKNSDEILILTWIITITISTSSGIIYIPTLTPKTGGFTCTGTISSCSLCSESSANSLLPDEQGNCLAQNLTSQYPQNSFITTQLFSDMFYNIYGVGKPNSFTYVSGTTLIIYIPYCTEYFIVGIYSDSPAFASSNTKNACYINSPYSDPVYLQVYMQSKVNTYIGVQIEFTT